MRGWIFPTFQENVQIPAIQQDSLHTEHCELRTIVRTVRKQRGLVYSMGPCRYDPTKESLLSR